LPDEALIPADAFGYSQKPRSDIGVVDATFFQFFFQKIERFAAEAIQKHILEDVADVVVSAEMVNEVEAEELHLSELPDEGGNLSPAAFFGDPDPLSGLD
jgi:hypothetical protein